MTMTREQMRTFFNAKKPTQDQAQRFIEAGRMGVANAFMRLGPDHYTAKNPYLARVRNAICAYWVKDTKLSAEDESIAKSAMQRIMHLLLLTVVRECGYDGGNSYHCAADWKDKDGVVHKGSLCLFSTRRGWGFITRFGREGIDNGSTMTMTDAANVTEDFENQMFGALDRKLWREVCVLLMVGPAIYFADCGTVSPTIARSCENLGMLPGVDSTFGVFLANWMFMCGGYGAADALDASDNAFSFAKNKPCFNALCEFHDEHQDYTLRATIEWCRYHTLNLGLVSKAAITAVYDKDVTFVKVKKGKAKTYTKAFNIYSLKPAASNLSYKSDQNTCVVVPQSYRIAAKSVNTLMYGGVTGTEALHLRSWYFGMYTIGRTPVLGIIPATVGAHNCKNGPVPPSPPTPAPPKPSPTPKPTPEPDGGDDYDFDDEDDDDDNDSRHDYPKPPKPPTPDPTPDPDPKPDPTPKPDPKPDPTPDPDPKPKDINDILWV